ncbi:MAG: ATP-binding protein [Anaerolineaceae bacterium]|nr:ATP-binding protein [Anaerolineaceae bacterium]
MINDVTYLGKVINVDSKSIEVEINSEEIKSYSPVINGRLYRIGQIGTLVKIPLGYMALYGIVSSVSNTPSKNEENFDKPNYGDRYLQVQLIGEKLGNMEFEKGIGTYPTVNDEVHIVVEDDLRSIYGGKKDGLLEIGKHSSTDNLSVFVDLQNFVLRHSAILGSTGSGKSNATAHITKSILRDYPGSRIVLIDPHGEYESAFGGDAKIFKINDPVNPLYIPFWIMTFDELSFFLVGRQAGQDQLQDKRLRSEIVSMKKNNASKLKAGLVNSDLITADSPIPFDIRLLWHNLNREVNGTYSTATIENQNEKTEELIGAGDPNLLIPATFKPYSMGAERPYKSKRQEMYSHEKNIYARLKDSRFDFMFFPGEFYTTESENDIDKLVRDWIDHDKRLTILDLSGVPFELIDLSVGLLTRIIFDSMYWGRFEEYTGRNRPILMVFEEAHSYLSEEQGSRFVYGYARKAVEKLFKEGRKFGVGAMVVSQRPSEISTTILSQVGTFIALRLTNNADQSTVKSASPNNMTNLIDFLPSLRIGEAVIVGESIKIPSRVRISLVEPRPSSNDPALAKNWNKTFPPNEQHYKNIITAIREQKQITKESK